MRFKFNSDAATHTESIRQIFSTPMLYRPLGSVTADMLKELYQLALDLESRTKGLNLSNFGGYHSPANFFEQGFDVVKCLARDVLAVSAEMSYEQIKTRYPSCQVEVGFYGGSWVNISRNGDYNKPHVHPGAVWSGVFYVATGERDPRPADNGCIEFIDPRHGNIHGQKIVLTPNAGDILLFPSWLYHYVNPFRGTGERISIAFNMNAEIIPSSG